MGWMMVYGRGPRACATRSSRETGERASVPPLYITPYTIPAVHMCRILQGGVWGHLLWEMSVVRIADCIEIMHEGYMADACISFGEPVGQAQYITVANQSN